MSEETNTEKIERLKQQLIKAEGRIPEGFKVVAEVPKEEPPKEITGLNPTITKGEPVISIGFKEPKKEKYVAPPPVYANEKPGDFAPVAKEKFTPPDPTAKLLNETPIHITWIDNRYHINGIRGAPNGNKIIVRTLDDIEQLSNDLLVGLKNFYQPTMINTKKPRILPKKTCIYLNEEGKCTNEHYFDGIKKQYTTKDRTCLFSNQDRCPQAD